MISDTRRASIAAAAALIASVGDLLLLYVANAQRSELGLTPIGRSWLWIGGAMGVVAIPFYALGYLAASRLVAAASARAAGALFVTGAAGALLGSIIHGLTTAYISADLDDVAALGRDPLASIASWGPVILTLWVVAGALVVVASALFSWFVGRGRTAAPRYAALANPALVTIALAGTGLSSALLGAFLIPAAPNIAHLVFFVLCSGVLSSSDSRGGGSVRGR